MAEKEPKKSVKGMDIYRGYCCNQNKIILDRNCLKNPKGFIFGVPGSGKRFLATDILQQSENDGDYDDYEFEEDRREQLD